MTSVEQASQSRSCAVIYNPTKVSDNALDERFRRPERRSVGAARDLTHGVAMDGPVFSVSKSRYC